MFKLNVGMIDRAIRVIIGVILVSLVFFGPMTNWGWIGLILIATGIFGMCPLYNLVGINTKKDK